MSKEQLLQELASAFEQAISTATEAAQRGLTYQRDGWGLRETLAHLAGWEIMATVRVPNIAAGMPPLEFADEAQQTVMDDAINATIVAMIGDQSLDTVCGILRQAYRRDIEMLKKLDDTLFQPGNYVYERTRGAIEHCQEHMQELISPRSSML
jgi:hypothetical protein